MYYPREWMNGPRGVFNLVFENRISNEPKNRTLTKCLLFHDDGNVRNISIFSTKSVVDTSELLVNRD